MSKFLQRMPCEKIVGNKYSLATILLLGGSFAASYNHCTTVNANDPKVAAFQKQQEVTRRISSSSRRPPTTAGAAGGAGDGAARRSRTSANEEVVVAAPLLVIPHRSNSTTSHLLATSISTVQPQEQRQQHHQHQTQDETLPSLARHSSSICLQEIPELFKSNGIHRTYQTPADQYYQKYGKIPLPRILHAVLDHGRLKSSRMDSMDPNDDDEGIFSETTARTVAADHDKDETSSSSHKILIVGDVHGCLDELKALVTKASMLHNDQKEFAAVILVGDLCNKGPYSAEVIQYVRSRRKRNWFSVRGNHDNAALAAALGDVHRQAKKKYDWVHSLSDEDVEWMSNLPYTITIRKEHLVAGNDIMKKRIQDDVIVVHAGLLPGLLSLEDQSIETMTTLRDVVKGRTQNQQEEEQTISESCDAWAKLWHGPEFIIFGHDAKRGLQKEKYAIGLDTGACYGKKLTGIVLPDEEFVSVDSFQSYCGITTKNSNVEVVKK